MRKMHLFFDNHLYSNIIMYNMKKLLLSVMHEYY